MKRIVLKISGEMLGCNESVFDDSKIDLIIDNVIFAHKNGIEIILISGGGNLIRGDKININSINKSTSHCMGMLSTIINSLALRDILKNKGCECVVFSSYSTQACCDYDVYNAKTQINKGKIVIIAGGTGRAHTTTDTASILAAAELEADVVVKATKVDGLYENDPNINKNSKFIPHTNYKDVLLKNLSVMDWQAFGLAKEKEIKIIVCKLNKNPESLLNILNGKNKHSLIS